MVQKCCATQLVIAQAEPGSKGSSGRHKLSIIDGARAPSVAESLRVPARTIPARVLDQDTSPADKNQRGQKRGPPLGCGPCPRCKVVRPRAWGLSFAHPHTADKNPKPITPTTIRMAMSSPMMPAMRLR